MKKENRIHYALIILLALCFIRSLSASAINNTGGLFLVPISEEIGVGIGNLSIYFSISSVATLFFMPIAGNLIQKHSMKKLMIFAAFLQCLSFIALGYMNNVFAWYILSIPMAVGSSILVNLCGPVLINRWFKTNTGTALGILMAFVGIFGAILQPTTISLISAAGWRNTYIILGLSVLTLILLFTIIFIKDNPHDKNTVALEIAPHQNHSQQVPTKDIPYKNAIKSKSFFGLLLFMVAITAFGAFQQHMATYLGSLGYSEIQRGTALSIGMLGSTFGALLIGLLSDKIGIYKSTLGVIAVVLLSLACLLFGANSLPIITLGVFLLGLSAIGIPVLAPILATNLFGHKDYERIYSSVMMGPPLATVILLPLYGFIFDKTQSYINVILLITIVVIIGSLAFIIGWKNKVHLKEQ